MKILKKFCLFILLFPFLSLAEKSLVNIKKNNGKVENEIFISQVVGMAGDQVVTSREVQIVNLLEKAFTNSSEDLKQINYEDSKFNLEITQVLLEIVVMNESLVFEMNQVKEEEFKESQQSVSKKLSVSSDWKKLQVSSVEFEKFLRRKMIAKRFIKIKSDSMKGLISDQEAKDYFEKNRLKFGQVPFSQFKENIKTFLAQQQLEERLTSWFEVIKKKYKVRNYHSEMRG